MILIQTSEIKTFLKRSGKIKTYPTLPVLTYVKLECAGDTATLTKTNMDAWCIHQVEADFKENHTILIDEKLLSALVSNSFDELIDIKLEGENIAMRCGKSKLSFAWIDPAMYPEAPEMNQENGLTQIGNEMLYAIRAASSIIDTSVQNQYTNCFIQYSDGKTDIFSTRSAWAMYKRTFEGRFPDITISPEVAGIITMFEEAQHYEANNYDFFDFGKTVYGFIRSVYKAPNFHVVFARCKNVNWFEVKRKDLLQFCELTVSSTPNPSPVMSLRGSEMLGVSFTCDDSGFRVSTKMDFEGDNTFRPPLYNFTPKILIPLLKTMDTDLIRFSPVTEGVYCIWSTEDPSLLTLLMGITTK
jgi:hypothetical protein